MDLRLTRLGFGDWLMLGGSAGLIADLISEDWFSYPNGFYGLAPGGHGHASLIGGFPAQNGWSGLGWLGPIAAMIAVIGLLTVLAQGLRRSPAVPVVLTVMLTPVVGLLFIALAIRTLISPPDGVLRRVGGAYSLIVDAGAYVGLGCAVVMVIGLYLSLRRDAVDAADAPAEIETIRLDAAAGT